MGQLAARRLAERGIKVAALDVNEAGLAETAKFGPSVMTWVCDVTDAAAVRRTVDEAERTLGPLHTVFNAAAIMPLGKLVEQDLDTIHRIMAVNYGGVVNVSKVVLPRLMERRAGNLVNFASMAGWLPVLLVGAYNASKFAVVAFTEVLYHENRTSGVRFACVCPPPVATPLLEQGRATAWPKLFDEGPPPLEPGLVLDAVEDTLQRDAFWVFLGPRTKFAWRMRRWFPRLVWREVHRIEGW
jgi:NAD(P)-dependent dehydrogenase (short-subunit alcohol dehydrogenase family)